ncbi:hypothetical protein OROHE_008012 [Orobanche hederae]
MSVNLGDTSFLLLQVSGRLSELKTTVDAGLVHRGNLLQNIGEQFEQWNFLFGPALESLNQSQHTPIHNDTPPLRVSTKGSCIAATNPSGEETNVDKVDRVELYVDEHPPRLVALGRVIEGGPTLHGMPLSGDLVRVIVEDVRDTDAPVPVPTSEDIAGPKKKRVRPIDNSESVKDPILELLKISPSLYENPLRVPLGDFFGVVDTEVPLYVYHTDVLEIIQGMIDKGNRLQLLDEEDEIEFIESDDPQKDDSMVELFDDDNDDDDDDGGNTSGFDPFFKPLETDDPILNSP